MFSSERLKGIDVFVAVADLGSFTAAAERLNLTSSAISKSVARLEARLEQQPEPAQQLVQGVWHILPDEA